MTLDGVDRRRGRVGRRPADGARGAAVYEEEARPPAALRARSTVSRDVPRRRVGGRLVGGRLGQGQGERGAALGDAVRAAGLRIYLMLGPSGRISARAPARACRHHYLPAHRAVAIATANAAEAAELRPAPTARAGGLRRAPRRCTCVGRLAALGGAGQADARRRLELLHLRRRAAQGQPHRPRRRSAPKAYCAPACTSTPSRVFQIYGSAPGRRGDGQPALLASDGLRRNVLTSSGWPTRPGSAVTIRFLAAVAISEGLRRANGRGPALSTTRRPSASGSRRRGHPQALFLRAPGVAKRAGARRARAGSSSRTRSPSWSVPRPPYVCFDQSMGSPSTVSIEFDTTALPSPCCLMASLSKTTFDDGSLAALGSAALLSMRGLLPRSSDTSYLSPPQRRAPK